MIIKWGSLSVLHKVYEHSKYSRVQKKLWLSNINRENFLKKKAAYHIRKIFFYYLNLLLKEFMCCIVFKWFLFFSYVLYYLSCKCKNFLITLIEDEKKLMGLPCSILMKLKLNHNAIMIHDISSVNVKLWAWIFW